MRDNLIFCDSEQKKKLKVLVNNCNRKIPFYTISKSFL